MWNQGLERKIKKWLSIRQTETVTPEDGVGGGGYIEDDIQKKVLLQDLFILLLYSRSPH